MPRFMYPLCPERHLAYEMQSSAGDDTAFSVSEIAIAFDKKYQKKCLACAHVYVGCEAVPMNIPQKIIVVESGKCNTMPKNTPFVFKKNPGKGKNVCIPTIDKKISHMCGIKYGYLG